MRTAVWHSKTTAFILIVWPAFSVLLGISAFLCFSDVGASAPTTSSPARQKLALVIGNAHYVAVPQLRNPTNDAQDVCKSLSDLGYQTFCYMDIKTRVQLRSIIQDYAEALSADSVSVIYYAGHALQMVGVNYLIPTDAKIQGESSVVTESVDLGYLMNQLRQTQSFLKVVIIDACRDNPLRSSAQPQELAQITDVPDGTVVLYATAADDLALDGQGRNGTLTKNLLAHLKEDGSIDDLFKRVSLGVQVDTAALGHAQKPALYTNFTGQYCFVRCTDLEVLQQQRRAAELQISDLEARVNAGDQSALTQLAEVRANNQKLLDQIRKKDEESKQAEKAAKEQQKKSFVPPAL